MIGKGPDGYREALEFLAGTEVKEVSGVGWTEPPVGGGGRLVGTGARDGE